MDQGEASTQLLQYVRRRLLDATVDPVAATDFHGLNLPVLHIDFPDNESRYLAIARSVIDHKAGFDELRRHLESHHWEQEVRDPSTDRLTLGERGWETSDWNFGQSLEGRS